MRCILREKGLIELDVTIVLQYMLASKCCCMCYRYRLAELLSEHDTALSMP